MIIDTLILTKRLLLASLKMPVFLILSLTQPVLYLVFFGQLFSKVPGLTADGSYIYFIAPGMIMLAAMFGSVYSGIGTISDADKGMFDRILTSPVSRKSIALSYIVSTCMVVFLQASIMLLVAGLMGVLPTSGLVGISVVLVVSVIIGVAFSSISNALAYYAGRSDIIMPILNIIAMPMLFLSNIMISVDMMPDWMAVIAKLNPLSWSVSATRAAYSGVWNNDIIFHLSLLIVFAGAMLLLMFKSFQRFLNNR